MISTVLEDRLIVTGRIYLLGPMRKGRLDLVGLERRAQREQEARGESVNNAFLMMWKIAEIL